MESVEQFDPAKHLTTIGKGSRAALYLEVKWRVAWLRSEHPDATVTTEMTQFANPLPHPETGEVAGYAVFRAEITIPGRGSATGWGSVRQSDFGDYLEKAETKAIGRACATLGYGTQFCADHEYDADNSGRVVDAPVARSSGGDASKQPSQPKPNGGGDSALATEQQIKFIRDMAAKIGLSDDAIHAEVGQAYGLPMSQLNRRNASAFIEVLKARRPVGAGAY